MKLKNLVLCSLVLVSAWSYGRAADGSDTYRNPVLWCDVPDVGLCTDGTNYYMVSTTMHLVPGVPIMKSGDMVNWEIVSYVMPRLPEDEPRYSLVDGKSAYGAGQWASSLRYARGKFWCWFIMNGTGGFLYTADRAEGPWTLYSRPGYRHDASLFFDDDGKTYLFHGDGGITELAEDLKTFKEGALDREILRPRDPVETALLEGSAVFKHDGYYYWMMVSAFIPGHPRREVCYRAKNIEGPYEKRTILELNFETWGGIGQGCVVNRGDEWWALVFQDRGGVGRVPCLMPVVWTDGWPMLGNERGDAIPNDTARKYPSLSGVMGSDDFEGGKLKLYWQFNHNPVEGAWSLAERPGWLRLKTASVVDNLFAARNTLTQRLCGPEATVAVKLDFGAMRDGDRAGLAAFDSEALTIGVEKTDGKAFIVAKKEKMVMDETNWAHRVAGSETEEFFRQELEGREVYLKIHADFRAFQDWADCAWSVDGENWRAVEGKVRLPFDPGKMFMGAKAALYSYATEAPGGAADFDDFTFETVEHE